MDVQMSEPSYFKPYALMKAPVITESRLIRDLSMPERDWTLYDAPACERQTSKRVRSVDNVTILRQAG
jgi:hypothetical protein